MDFLRRLNRASVLLASLLATADSLRVQISLQNGTDDLLSGKVDGRVVLMFAPNGTDPLADIDVTSTPNYMFGKNVFGFDAADTIAFAGGSGDVNATGTGGVYGFPLVSMDDLPAGAYRVQAFLNLYDRVERSDGSVVHLKFPCGDGAPQVNGVGSLVTPAVDVEVAEEDDGSPQTISLSFDSVTPIEAFTGREIGKCEQGNYADTELLKYVKIRSAKLSEFWGRDMYVGATVLLPAGYDANDETTRYPVLYSQGHWPSGKGPFSYPTAAFSKVWDAGMIPGDNKTAARPAPKLILVRFRHEAPFYDDSYGVNTANLGPYGDALNDELIPYLDSLFHTIAAPYARIQEGGSTGGWISAASVIFRPDLFGACFSSYPDSLTFAKHQDISLYGNSNAYRNADDGSRIGSIRAFDSPGNDTETILATVEQENHWELVFGTASRSSLQWDAWNAVFGAQGLNGYPLEPWDKVTGEVYPDAVAYWKEMGMDIAEYIAGNWGSSINASSTNPSSKKNLGEALRGRIHVYVGTHDDYYLNEGVAAFAQRVNAPQLGGPGWANITMTPGATHGGNYQRREIWNYLEFVADWVRAHGPEGATPLSAEATSSANRGNRFEEIVRIGGRAAALARQADPTVEVVGGGGSAKCGGVPKITGTVGRWDPGVKLEAQWVVDGEASGAAFGVKQGDVVRYAAGSAEAKRAFGVRLRVKGTQRNYEDETRESDVVKVTPRRR
ncbi:uncharacterized protein PG986_000083 [Apiospora aurea]|uniref:Uncharacterized protein n=1 Tax=Apiospora aurea TaxID=335848 RepID=A0ABR1QTY1_9PEZI